ncbi:hypothetical protein HBI52_232980 [Parastagonospora nodorum]|nr:hypothetical protein HBI52_232980 [Parastagonospora nodorum]KAH5507880.1 hypothetical protein HBI31_039720 [Parastagonospora nodorum]KAH5984625.1 hypothetical protein HBI84_232390 [Parastagonospora nodorum]KAH6045823.1 hypothetical protein HBI54_088470 [Parastagonospora nodorum]
MAKPMLFIIGAPGSGKGTLCKKLHEEYGFTHLSVGDMMREHMSSANTNSEIVQCMQSGQLLPIEALAPILRAQIEYEREGSRVLLIDDFPRRLDQAEPVEALVGRPIMVLFFNCPEQVAMNRFLTRKLAGREKDDGEMFTKRFQEFDKLNPDIVEHYRKRGLLLEVDTSGETMTSFQMLKSALEKTSVWSLLTGMA